MDTFGNDFQDKSKEFVDNEIQELQELNDLLASPGELDSRSYKS